MAIELTKEQLDITLRFIVMKMREAKVNIGNPGEVMRYMILNPIPDHEDVVREHDEEMEKERKRRIVILTEELEKLEGQ